MDVHGYSWVNMVARSLRYRQSVRFCMLGWVFLRHPPHPGTSILFLFPQALSTPNKFSLLSFSFPHLWTGGTGRKIHSSLPLIKMHEDGFKSKEKLVALGWKGGPGKEVATMKRLLNLKNSWKINRKFELKGICHSCPHWNSQSISGEIQTKPRRQNLLCWVPFFLWRLFWAPRLCSGDQVAGHPSPGPLLHRHTIHHVLQSESSSADPFLSENLRAGRISTTEFNHDYIIGCVVL